MWFRNAKRIRDLEHRVELAEKKAASMGSDFLELEDKVYRWMQRAVQRTKREVSAGPDRFDLVNQEPTDDPISREIRRQRARTRRSEPSDTTDGVTSSPISAEPLVPPLPTSR
jgi:hypothetical protein